MQEVIQKLVHKIGLSRGFEVIVTNVRQFTGAFYQESGQDPYIAVVEGVFLHASLCTAES